MTSIQASRKKQWLEIYKKIVSDLRELGRRQELEFRAALRGREQQKIGDVIKDIRDLKL